MATLKSLAVKMNAEAYRLDDLASEAAVWLALTIAEDLIRTTPVDTSRALSNWLITLGGPSNYGTIDYAAGNFGNTRWQSVARATARVQSQVVGKVPGQSIFISNVVNYIVALNQGSSKQAPAMFVENSILRGRMLLRERIKNGGFR